MGSWKEGSERKRQREETEEERWKRGEEMKGSLLEHRLPAAADGRGQTEGDAVKSDAKIFPKDFTVKRDHRFMMHKSPF